MSRARLSLLWRGRRAFIRANHSDSGAACTVEREIDYHNIQKLDQLLKLEGALGQARRVTDAIIRILTSLRSLPGGLTVVHELWSVHPARPMW